MKKTNIYKIWGKIEPTAYANMTFFVMAPHINAALAGIEQSFPRFTATTVNMIAKDADKVFVVTEDGKDPYTAARI